MKRDIHFVLPASGVVILVFFAYGLRAGWLMGDRWTMGLIYGGFGAVLCVLGGGVWLFIQARRRAERRNRPPPLNLG